MSSNSTVTIRVTRTGFEYCCYEELDKVNVDILVDAEVVGKITADLIDRNQIPENGFYEAFDSYSHEMLNIGTELMEPRFGRMKLKSLVDHDNAQRGFMYIETFQVSHVDNKEEIATQALHQFLNHPLILGRNKEDPKVTSVAYVLDPEAHLTPEEVAAREAFMNGVNQFRACDNSVDEIVKHKELKRKWDAQRDKDTYEDAIPFFRNGFFEDNAVSPGEGFARYIVASCGDFTSPPKSSKEARAMPFKVESRPAEPARKTVELNAYIDRQMEIEDLEVTRKEIESYVREGARILESDIMHIACQLGRSNLGLAKLILELEPSVINQYSSKGETPLMLAARDASICGDLKLVDFLLKAGADISLCDNQGRTTYDLLMKGRVEDAGLIGLRERMRAPIPTRQELDRLYSMVVPPGRNVAQDLYEQSFFAQRFNLHEERRPGLINYHDEDFDSSYEEYYEDEDDDDDEDFDASNEES
eukprot:Nitzschia sp. Nitz4//scaffold23_size168460//166772//168196//NITZ4_002252-RA/size168460-processed-gene-0.278-mRNA-1//-1//CDS//3329543734//5195//frame0